MTPIRLGVLGLGRAFTLMVPTFTGDTRVKLVAAFDPREGARAAFEQTFGGTAQTSAEAVCADPAVEWVYVATPHQMHVDHVVNKVKVVQKVKLDDLANLVNLVRMHQYN